MAGPGTLSHVTSFDAIDDESPDEVLASVAPGDVQAAAGEGVPRPAAPALA